MTVKIFRLLCVFILATGLVSSAQTLTPLVNFNGSNGSGPQAPMIQGGDGNFYGTTVTGGGATQYGSVFKMTPSGALTTLYGFCQQANCTDGKSPAAALVQGSDGNFYGTTMNGGSGLVSGGTVFKMTPSGALTTIYSFCSQSNCVDGGLPLSPLVQAPDGNFYGTTGGGGAYGAGTVFKITPNGALTTIYSFCQFTGCPDGAFPTGAFIQGMDGNFYGTTQGGAGTLQTGTAFKISSTGTFTKLYQFCSQANCTDGSFPVGGITQGSDGNFYGTTTSGGNTNCGGIGCGTAFKMSPTGVLTTLYKFCTQNNCTDGSTPWSALVQATDGNFYGTTRGGGGSGQGGTAFQITSAGRLVILYNFCSQGNCTDGSDPYTGLTFAVDGSFYGSTLTGGTVGDGTLFKLTTSLSLSPVEFITVSPCRVVDTRQTHLPIQGGTSQDFIVPQLGGCGIPPNAAAYSLNVTAIPHGHLGYLTIWPTGRSQPTVSTMNSNDGRVKANAAIVPAGAAAAVSVFASDTTDLVLDINGYFAVPGGQSLQFYPVTPCRIVDTRNGRQGGTLQGGAERDYGISGNCGIPGTAEAYSFNVTVLPAAGGLDYLTVWPQGQSRPTVSTLNDPTGTIVANAAIVPAGSNHATAFYPHNNNTDLLLDVNGYFAPPGNGGQSFYPAVPCRALDTRQNNGPPFQGRKTVNIEGSVCAPPSGAQAYVFNATVVPPGPMGYLTLWPDGDAQPTVSTLNAPDGAITSNMAVVPTNNGSVDAYAAALTHLLLDIYGYFAP